MFMEDTGLPNFLAFPYFLLIPLIPIVVCEFVLIALAIRNRRKKAPASSGVQENLTVPKPKATPITKTEISENTLRLLVAKGFVKKKWVPIREIPVYEIEGIETFGDELTVTWNGAAEAFFMKKNAGALGRLRDDVNLMIEEHKKSVAYEEKAALRKSDLLSVINASVGIVDLSFDVLVGLQTKRIKWHELETTAGKFGANLSFTGQTVAPLNLDFTKISLAIQNQTPKEASAEIYAILKAIYEYFQNLNMDDDLKENYPNFENAQAVIFAYYTLNDLLLGKILGKENEKENSQFEAALQKLSVESSVKVDFAAVKECMGKIGVEDSGDVFEDCRGILREQMANLDKAPEKPAEPAPEPMPEQQPAQEVIAVAPLAALPELEAVPPSAEQPPMPEQPPTPPTEQQTPSQPQVQSEAPIQNIEEPIQTPAEPAEAPVTAETVEQPTAEKSAASKPERPKRKRQARRTRARKQPAEAEEKSSLDESASA
jgi:hypothetical protein